MEKLSQIKKELRNGDQKLCAELTGYSLDYVKMVVREIRNNEKIVKTLGEIIKSRKALFARIKSFNYKK